MYGLISAMLTSIKEFVLDPGIFLVANMCTAKVISGKTFLTFKQYFGAQTGMIQVNMIQFFFLYVSTLTVQYSAEEVTKENQACIHTGV